MIHTTQPNGGRCGGTLIPCLTPWGSLMRPSLSRCIKCGQVGVPYIPAPKTRSRPGESLSDPARTASVLRMPLTESIPRTSRSHKVIGR